MLCATNGVGWRRNRQKVVNKQLLTLQKRDKLKRFLAILFILSLTAPFTVPFIYLNYQKKQVKKEVKEKIISGLERKHLVFLTFSRDELYNELSWHHSHEFEYNGEMYDVVEANYKEDSVSFWCWQDKEEKSIDEKIDELVTQTLINNPRNQENQKRINNYYKIHFLQCNQGWNPISVFKSKVPCHKHISFYTSVYITPPLPPPKTV
jgi:hypothetical protein